LTSWLNFGASERCDLCGRFINPNAPGVSWSQSWGYCMDGSPDLYDPTYRCSPCTDAAGVKPSNCATGYPGNGRNDPPPPSDTGGAG
jgi:hypothetical protein